MAGRYRQRAIRRDRKTRDAAAECLVDIEMRAVVREPAFVRVAQTLGDDARGPPVPKDDVSVRDVAAIGKVARHLTGADGNPQTPLVVGQNEIRGIEMTPVDLHQEGTAVAAAVDLPDAALHAAVGDHQAPVPRERNAVRRELPGGRAILPAVELAAAIRREMQNPDGIVRDEHAGQ